MKTLAPPEERKIGLKNNTSCVSPAPIQHFSITWPLSVLAVILLEATTEISVAGGSLNPGPLLVTNRISVSALAIGRSSTS